MRTVYPFLFFSFLLVFGSIAQTPGNSLSFDAATSYVSANLPAVFDNINTNDFTIEAWVRPVSSSGSKRIFFAQKDADNFVSVLLNGTNVLYVFLEDNGTSYSINSQITVPLNTWTHFATTWDASSNTLSVYINGTLISGIYGGGSSFGTDNAMAIGARTDGTQIFKGAIDEFRVWSDLRTLCEINGSMNTSFTSTQPNLVAAYDFNQGVAGGNNAGVTTLSELNGNFDGTLNGFQLTGSTSNWIASGAGISTQNNNDATIHLQDVETACVQYQWINSTTYTSSVSGELYNYTSGGCPVEHLLDLTINQPATSVDIITACESYTWLDANTYTASENSATYTFPGGAANGCDSIVTLNLTIHSPTSGTDVQTACESYTWIDGNTYTANNNTATFTLINANGCDSVVTLDLTILNATAATDIITACESFTWIDGNTYTTNNNTATYTLTNANGCDSLVTLDLTILNATAATDIITACESFTWIDGNTYTVNNNTATYTLTNAQGCDSVVTLDLTVTTIAPTVSVTGVTLSADQSGADYQWIDCNNGNSPISGANDQSYVASENGSYAVIITVNNCSDTSACQLIENANTHPLTTGTLSLYPNPNDGAFTLELGDNLQAGKQVRIVNALGEVVFADDFILQQQNFRLDLPKGYYIAHYDTVKLAFVIQ